MPNLIMNINKSNNVKNTTSNVKNTSNNVNLLVKKPTVSSISMNQFNTMQRFSMNLGLIGRTQSCSLCGKH